MDTRETIGGDRVMSSVVEQEPTYDGHAGRTRLEPIHVTLPGGFVRTVHVYRAVNVGTDPQLREAATSGALHRFEGGEELAIPFIYHDPQARKLALVVPDVLRHQELSERARLIGQLAEDREHPVPSYVREARVVIGYSDLAAYLDEPRPSVAPSPVDAAATGELEQREQRLVSRAEDVTRREDEARTMVEMLEAQQRDLALREQELESRLAILQQREAALGGRGSVPPPANEPVSDVDELEAVSTNTAVVFDAAAVAEEVEAELLEDVEEILDDEDVAEMAEEVGEEPDEVEVTNVAPMPARSAAVATVTSVEDMSEEELAAIEEVGPEDLADVAFADDPDSDDPDADGPTVSEADQAAGELLDDAESPGGEPAIEAAEDQPDADEPQPPVAPPDGFGVGPRAQLAATVTAEGTWLFARLADGGESFESGGSLLAQLHVVEGYPTVILALVGGQNASVCRAALDPFDSDDRAVLDALAADFTAAVAFFDVDGRFVDRTAELSADRAENVQRILARVGGGARPQSDISAAEALQQALDGAPSVAGLDHPFQATDPETSNTARAAADALSALVPWSDEDKQDELLLRMSVPESLVRGTTHRVLEDALLHGLALPPTLLGRAVELGLGASPEELVTGQLTAFAVTTQALDRGGLAPVEVAACWEQLLAAANEHEVEVDPEVQELAWKAEQGARYDSEGPTGLSEVDAATLPAMGVPELVMLLSHPRVRKDAALELCRRSDPDLLDPIFKAVRRMPRSEVLSVVPRVLEQGEAAGDALIDGLSARKTFVRQASAIGLGHLKLRRAVVPLVHLLQNEPSDVWQEVARVLGEFGVGAFRALSRGLKDPEAPRDRFSYALAHVANHGGEARLEEMSKDEDRSVGVVAVEALNLRQDAKRDAARARGELPTEDDDTVRTFATQFYAELSKDRGAEEPGVSD